MANRLIDFLRHEAEGKALADHRFFHDDAPLTVYTPQQKPNRERGLLSQREAKHHLQAYGGSEAMDWVHDAVSLYSEPTGGAPWHLEKNGERVYKSRTDDTPPGASIGDPILYDLLEEPNPYMDYDEMMQLMVIDLLIVGNAYWYKYRMLESGKPLALYRLSPSDVKILPGTQGADKYVYSPSGTDKKLEISPEEVIHFKRPNPHNPYYGLGMLKGAGRAADIDLALTDAQAHYYENKADPSLIVESERRVPRDVFRKLRMQLRARVSGRHNAGELLVLEAGLKANSVSPNAREAMYKELSEMSRDRVLAWFKANPKLLGIAEGGTQGDKVQDARREFDNHALRPFLDKIQRKLSRELTGFYGYDFVIDYRYIMPPEELVKLSGDFASVPGVKVKEVREFLKDGGLLREISTGDEDIDELVLNLPGEELDEDGQGGFADRSLPREAGRPPKGENTRAIPRGGGALPAGSRARRPQGKALEVDEVLERLGELRAEGKAVELESPERTTVGNKLPDEQRPPDGLADARAREINAITAEMRQGVLDALHVTERELMDNVEGKAFDPKAALKRVRNSNAWKLFASVLRTNLQESAEVLASSAAVQHAEQGIQSQDDLSYSEIAESVLNRPEGIRGITANLRKAITKKLEKLPDDATQEDYNAMIRETSREWRDAHAETIAMTEAVEVYNEASLTVMEGAGHEEVFVEDGHDHDEPCAEADGSVWPIDYARKHRSEHPRCRRAFIPVTA